MTSLLSSDGDVSRIGRLLVSRVLSTVLLFELKALCMSSQTCQSSGIVLRKHFRDFAALYELGMLTNQWRNESAV